MVFRDRHVRRDISRIDTRSRSAQRRITLNNAMSITPWTPAVRSRGRFRHGSNLGEKIQPERVRSHWKSTTTAFTFTVTRSGDLSGAAGVDWVVSGGRAAGTVAANGADFAGGQLPAGRVNFAPSQAIAPVTVRVAGDSLAELNERFTVTLSNAQAGVAIGTAAAVGAILNDDFASTSANQTLNGTGAPDLFLLGGGLDTVLGEAGIDLFRFLPSALGPAASNATTLQDFSRAAGEVIDLSAIDAIAGTAADNPFSFIGTAAFSGAAGQLRWQDQGDGTLLIQGNVNTDTVADLTIIVKAPGPIDSN